MTRYMKASPPQENDEALDSELEEEIKAVQERLLMNQMPPMGDLRKADAREIRKSTHAFQALISWKESKSIEIRQGYAEKLRKMTAERDSLESKCLNLERKL